MEGLEQEALDSNGPLMALPEDVRESMAQRLCLEIDQWETTKDQIKRRWDKAEQIYYCDPAATSQNVVDGIGTYAVSLWRPKCDKLVGDIVGSIVGSYPPVQVLEDNAEGVNNSELERVLSALATKSGFESAFAQSTFVAANTNLGVLRCRPLVDEEGMLAGLETDWLHPKDVCFYPVALDDPEQCRTVGHRFYKPKWEIEELQKKKLYYPCELAGNDDPDTTERLNGAFDIAKESNEVDDEDGFVECWELITRQRIKGKWRRLLVVVARSSKELLSCVEYPYSKLWYVRERLTRTEKRIITSDSVANGVQGYCLAAGDLLNAMVQAYYLTAYPLVWTRGTFTHGKAKKYTPGEIVDLGSEGEMGSLKLDFDGNGANVLFERFEKLVDSTIGVSRLGTSDNLPASTKATAINAIVDSDQKRQASYLDAAAETVERYYELLFEYLIRHYDDLAQVYGSAATLSDREALDGQYRFSVTGRNGAGSPGQLLQKFQMLLEMTANPESSLDFAKLEEKMLDAMDLPFDGAGLQKDEFTELKKVFNQLQEQGLDPMQLLEMGAQAMQAQGMQTQGGMGGFADGNEADLGFQGLEGGESVSGPPQEPGLGGNVPMLPGGIEGLAGQGFDAPMAGEQF